VDEFARQIIAALLVSLRIVPTLAFAPPFTLMRIPALVRLALAVALGLWLASLFPDQTWRRPPQDGYVAAIAAELFLGIMLALALQLAFAGLLMAGRAIDIQAGFGLSMLIDPSTRSQVPLAGMLLSYAAGAIFFLTSGPADLFALLAQSVRDVPLGAVTLKGKLPLLIDYTGTVFLLAFGAAGLIILTLFIVDLAIAFMSRTMPQMNVLVLGFQVKTLVVFAVLPIAIGASAGLLVRLLRVAIEAMTGMA
jgi:flagellar biosynthesis protein FliR